MSWQPIETAPKDGSLMWLGKPYSLRVGFWASGDDYAHKGSVGGGWRDFNEGRDLAFVPTHWHSVPDAPAEPDATSPASQVGMEGEARNETLIERLEGMADEFAKVRPHIGSDGPTETLLRESARTIRDLEAENARLRSAPSGAVAWAEADLEKAAWAQYPKGGSSRHANFRQAFRFGAHWGLLAAPQSEPLPGGVHRDELIALIMEETTDKHVADGWNVVGEPNILVQGCRFAAAGERRSVTDGYEHPEIAARTFAGYIADRILAALSTEPEATDSGSRRNG